MLMVNRERFGRLARDVARAPADVEQLTPAAGGLVVLPPPPQRQRERAKRVNSYRRD